MLGHDRRSYIGIKLVLFFMALFAGLWWGLSTAIDSFGVR